MATTCPYLNLPVELVEHTLDYTTSYRDLKALCLTCKTLQALAAPRLYREILLPLSSMTDKLKRSINRVNPWLRCTRVVRLTWAFLASESEQSLDGPIRDLMLSFPRNSLEIFDAAWSGESRLEHFKLLWTTQCQVVNLMMPDRINCAFVPLARSLENISVLTIRADFTNECIWASAVLSRVGKLQHLNIFKGVREFFDHPFRPWTDAASDLRRMNLKSLSLHGYHFSRCEELDPFLKAIEFSQLKALFLVCCTLSPEVQ
jgi:hypothetical protein